MSDTLLPYEPPLNVTRWPRTWDHFYVRSQHRGKKQCRYTVILGEKEFPRGYCNCAHFTNRIAPKIERGLPIRDRECKHLKKLHSVIHAFELLCVDQGEPPEYAPLRIPDCDQYERSSPYRGRFRGYL